MPDINKLQNIPIIGGLILALIMIVKFLFGRRGVDPRPIVDIAEDAIDEAREERLNEIAEDFRRDAIDPSLVQRELRAGRALRRELRRKGRHPRS